MIETKKSQRPIFVLNGEVDSNDLMNNIPEDFDGDIIINGCLKLFGDVKANASIWVVGNILNFCENSSIEVAGDLICIGDNWCSGNLIVHGVCYCGGDISNANVVKAEDLECDGKFYTEGDITAVDVSVERGIECSSIEARGNLTCNRCIDTYNIEVEGNLTCNGGIDAVNIAVGGDLTCYSGIGIHSSDIEVKGDLTCTGDIDSGNITVGCDFLCDGNIDSFDITVEGDMLYNGHIDTNGGRIIVKGEEIFDY